MNVEGSNPFARSNFQAMNKVVVYALRSETGQLYVGLTKNLLRRLSEHARRQSPSTRRLRGELELIYSREFSSYAEARRHEKYLKSGAGRKFLDERQGVGPPKPCQGLARFTG